MPSLIKHILNAVRNLSVFALVIFCHGNSLFAQGTDLLKHNRPGFFIGLSTGPSQSAIEITTTHENLSQLVSARANSSFGSIVAGYMISRNIGLSAGAGYNSYGTKSTMSSYSGIGDAVDDESEHFDLSIFVLDLEEKQKINSLIIPVNLILRLPISKMLGFYFEPGVNISVPVSKVFSGNGTFTFKGYYPAYNVTLENLPSHNFPSRADLSYEGDLILKNLWVSASASGGIDIVIQRKIQITAGISYLTSLSNISGYKSPEKFQLSDGYPEINSLMGSANNTTINSFGINLGLRYFMR